MLFNSYEYLFFLPIVAIIYFILSTVKARIIWLLLASYFFYMCWNPVFIMLILITTLVDYWVGRRLDTTSINKKRKTLLWLSLAVNIGILFYFKYYNFLRENLQDLIDHVGFNLFIPEHHWLLPVGISFYTFQTLSYTIDVYYKKQKAEHNFFVFALYVSFFPQLVAGPIERSTNLLPQFKELHSFDYERVRSGLFLILFGLFKKIVIADRFALYADEIFDNPEGYTGMAAIMGMVFFTFQIYCDFSGYTDVAIGSARVLGYNLMENFKGPYFSKSIKEFWRRWHISLSTWFRDYLYIPLGGNRGGKYKLYRNLIIVFLVTGIWHGANWTFVLWGAFHGVFLILERLGWGRLLDKLPSFFRVAYVFIVVSVGWVFFRADSIATAFSLLNSFITIDNDFWNINIYQSPVDIIELQISLFLMGVIILVHFFEYQKNIIESVLNAPVLIRWPIYIVMIYSIPLLGQYGVYKPFIYFQF